MNIYNLKRKKGEGGELAVIIVSQPASNNNVVSKVGRKTAEQKRNHQKCLGC